jgi:hypothetical protein
VTNNHDFYSYTQDLFMLSSWYIQTYMVPIIWLDVQQPHLPSRDAELKLWLPRVFTSTSNNAITKSLVIERRRIIRKKIELSLSDGFRYIHTLLVYDTVRYLRSTFSSDTHIDSLIESFRSTNQGRLLIVLLVEVLISMHGCASTVALSLFLFVEST